MTVRIDRVSYVLLIKAAKTFTELVPYEQVYKLHQELPISRAYFDFSVVRVILLSIMT